MYRIQKILVSGMTFTSWKDHGELEDCSHTIFCWWVCEGIVWPTQERNQHGCYSECSNKSFQGWNGVVSHMKGSSTGSVCPLWEAKTVPKGWMIIAFIALSWFKEIWFQIPDSEITIINRCGIFRFHCSLLIHHSTLCYGKYIYILKTIFFLSQ